MLSVSGKFPQKILSFIIRHEEFSIRTASSECST